MMTEIIITAVSVFIFQRMGVCNNPSFLHIVRDWRGMGYRTHATTCLEVGLIEHFGPRFSVLQQKTISIFFLTEIMKNGRHFLP